jgi:NAD-dependent dihydropyrimidine dehydrogenase PreA subunit
MNKPNISDIHDCYGCGVCSKPCPVHIVGLKLNANGFYEPYITDPDKCIHCGLCRDVCAYIKDERAVERKSIVSYAAWSNDAKRRRIASSGGVGLELALYLLEQGYKTVGVRYNAEKGRAEHFIASTPEEIIVTTGSKYIQSYPVDAWSGIDRKGKYLVTGTPCQIDSFRNYMKKMRLPEENFILLDFFCHGVPSMLAWKKYTADVEKKLGGKITYASWRNKWDNGWHDSWIMGINTSNEGKPVDWHDSYNLLIREKKTFIQSRFSQGDKFFRLFLGDCCLGPHCYHHCKYKWDRSSADIRICDLWGKTYQDNQEGVSGVVVYSQKALDILKAANVHLIEHPFETVAEGQMKASPVYQRWFKKVMESLKNPSKNIDDTLAVIDHAHKVARWKSRIKYPLRKIYHILKRL